ncbi:uncharacterized protein LOC124266271 [Haliotis rubra]|uniref:uncharacterized protein LOC124266271 n=1 Tax=Haliotis rubra TaxID=36100 RepID=UPI001EE53038|nr:uncharacterized protein LOC124266271 [Haliotis rubra]
MYGSVLLYLLVVVSYNSGELLCPEIAELGSTVTLSCIKGIATRAHSYSTPIGTTAATCDLSKGYCINLGDFTASALNESSSFLTIPRLLEIHAGDWACVVDADDPNPDTCNVTVQKSPSCRITSTQNTRALIAAEELSLTVYVRSFYCSESVIIGVKTGNITSHSIKETVTKVTDSTENVTFNMTASHFGNVTLVFSCGTKNQHVLCEGIQSLVESVPTVPTTQTAVTNTSTTQRGSTGGDQNTAVIISVSVVITIAIFTIILVVLWRRRRQISPASHRSKKYVNVHYVSNAEAGCQVDKDRKAKNETDLQVGKKEGRATHETDIQVGKEDGMVKHETDLQVGKEDGRAKHETDLQVGKDDGRAKHETDLQVGKEDGKAKHEADIQMGKEDGKGKHEAGLQVDKDRPSGGQRC